MYTYFLYSVQIQHLEIFLSRNRKIHAYTHTQIDTHAQNLIMPEIILARKPVWLKKCPAINCKVELHE